MTMPTKLQKSFSDYFSKMKKPFNSLPSKNLSSSGSWILRGCRHPRTPSFVIPVADDRQNGGQVTLADVDRFLFENFKSIYLNEKHEQDNVSNELNLESIPCDSVPSLKLEDSPWFGVTHDRGSLSLPFKVACTSVDAASSSSILATKPNSKFISYDFVSVLKSKGSHKFGRTLEPSLLDSLFEVARTSVDIASSSSITAATGATTLNDLLRSNNDDDGDDGDHSNIPAKENSSSLEDFITVLTYSSTPYDEFKRSMQEMMEVRLNHHGKIDWEFMEELLLCYLNLNDKKSYKFVLSAFADLIAVFGLSSSRVPAKSGDVGSAEGRGKEKGA